MLRNEHVPADRHLLGETWASSATRARYHGSPGEAVWTQYQFTELITTPRQRDPETRPAALSLRPPLPAGHRLRTSALHCLLAPIPFRSRHPPFRLRLHLQIAGAGDHEACKGLGRDRTSLPFFFLAWPHSEQERKKSAGQAPHKMRRRRHPRALWAPQGSEGCSPLTWHQQELKRDDAQETGASAFAATPCCC